MLRALLFTLLFNPPLPEAFPAFSLGVIRLLKSLVVSFELIVGAKQFFVARLILLQTAHDAIHQRILTHLPLAYCLHQLCLLVSFTGAHHHHILSATARAA